MTKVEKDRLFLYYMEKIVDEDFENDIYETLDAFFTEFKDATLEQAIPTASEYIQRNYEVDEKFADELAEEFLNAII